MIVLHTNHGDIKIRLDYEKAPKTAANFEQYVRDGFYNGTLFHRVIANFMIQGGGYTEDFTAKATREPIRNEANNGLSNKRGTIAMARTNDPHSATAQFFINVVDNGFLDFTSETPQGWGYAVFGEVVEGMDVVDSIKETPTGIRNMMQDVPLENVIIQSAEIIEDTE
ncbi:MAG: peptidyl-prolyl cis-trans isomerase [Gammaproteobacteria bacterium]|nr:MAG: peptidyl-prolyl cis-trans isomerase [Gammaproteobacteria bacterium]